MKKVIFNIIILFVISSCSLKNNYLVKFHKGKFNEMGVPSGYVDLKGDTIIPMGKYYYC